jgi:hypothetical protein
VLEEGAHRKYPERAKAPVEALARLAAGDCSIAAAAAVVVAAPAVAAADVEPAAAAVVVVAAAAAAAADAAVLAAAVEAQELASFVADHQMSPTLRWTWETGED